MSKESKLPSQESFMGVLSVVGNIISVIDKVNTTVDKVNKTKQTVNSIFDFVDDNKQFLKGASSNSLSQLTKETTITARAFIDETLMNDEEIVKDMLDYSHVVYTNMIIIAMQLNNFVQHGKKISDILKPISTEDNTLYIPLSERIKYSLEASVDQSTFDARKNIEAKGYISGQKDLKQDLSNNTYISQIKDIEQVPTSILPIGKVFAVSLRLPDGNNGFYDAVLHLNARVIPYYINNEILTNILGEKTNLSWTKRFIQFRSGEISFWKDFILGMDTFQQAKKYMIQDKSGAYAEYNKMIAQKTGTFASKLVNIMASIVGREKGKLNGTVNSNIANTIFIVTEDTIEQVRLKTGIDLMKKPARDKFFNSSYVMILMVIDAFGQVSVMLNGYDEIIKFPASQFKSKKKNNDNDFVNMLKQLASGSLRN